MTFLDEKLGKDTFKKYNNEKKCFEGAFSNASYEAILVGVAENIEKLQSIDLKKCIDLKGTPWYSNDYLWNGAFFLCAFFAFGAGKSRRFASREAIGTGRRAAYMNKEVPLGDAR